MSRPGLPAVKVCCIASPAEADLAIRLGARALGLVSAMPSGPGVIGEDDIAGIAADVPPGVATFLLTSKTDPDEIADQVRRLGTSTVQLVDRLEPGAHEALRGLLPDTVLVQVVHVVGPGSVDEATDVAAHVDFVLLDSGNPSLETKELGGTGRAHDWAISREIVRALETPVWLAGGLRPENVGEAIETVSPYGLDLCSGVRRGGAPGRKPALAVHARRPRGGRVTSPRDRPTRQGRVWTERSS